MKYDTDKKIQNNITPKHANAVLKAPIGNPVDGTPVMLPSRVWRRRKVQPHALQPMPK